MRRPAALWLQGRVEFCRGRAADRTRRSPNRRADDGDPSHRIDNGRSAAYRTEIPTEPSTEPIPFTEPALEAVPFQAQYVRTDHYVEGAEYPQSRLVRSREELLAFYNEFLGGDSLMRASGPASAVPSEFEFYDEDFFLDRSLIVVRLEEGSGSNRHEVTDVLLDSGAYLVQITRILPGPGYAGTCDMAEWHILIEIPKAEDDVPPDAVNLQLTVSETGK